jgi:hypothetical protein
MIFTKLERITMVAQACVHGLAFLMSKFGNSASLLWAVDISALGVKVVEVKDRY